jgi:hypothetical protein
MFQVLLLLLLLLLFESLHSYRAYFFLSYLVYPECILCKFCLNLIAGLSISNFQLDIYNRHVPPTNKAAFPLQPATATARRVEDVEVNYFDNSWKFQAPVSFFFP